MGRRIKITLLILLSLSAILTLLLPIINRQVEKAVIRYINTHAVDQEKANTTIKDLKLSILKERISIYGLKVHAPTTQKQPNAYSMAIPRVTIQLKAILPLLLRKELLIDSIYCERPSITVDLMKEREDKPVSTSQVIGNTYRSLRSILKLLYFERFIIHEGDLQINKKFERGSTPFHLKKFNLMISSFSSESLKRFESEGKHGEEVVIFEAPGQQVNLLNNRNSIAFKTILLHSGRDLIEMDSCTIIHYGKEQAGNQVKLFLDTIRIRRLRLDRLYHESFFEADTIECYRPDIKLFLVSKSHVRDTIDTRKHRNFLSKLANNYLIHQIILIDAETSLEHRAGLLTNRHKLDELDIMAKEIHRSDATHQLLRIDSLAINLSDYTLYLNDSSRSMHFDSLLISKNKIHLINYIGLPLKRQPKGLERTLHVDQLDISDIDWIELLAHKRVVAGSITLRRPRIQLVQRERATHPRAGNDLFRILSNIGFRTDVHSLYMHDASIIFKDPRKGTALNLQNLDISISPEKVFSAGDISNLERSINTFQFSNGSFSNKKSTIKLHDLRFDYKSKSTTVRDVSFRSADGSVEARLLKVRGGIFNIDPGQQTIQTDHIYWDSAYVSVHQATQPVHPTKKNNQKVRMNTIRGRRTTIDLDLRKNHITSQLNDLAIEDFGWKDSKPSFQWITLSGENTNVILANGIILKAGQFRMDKEGQLDINKPAFTKGNNNATAEQLTAVLNPSDLLNKDLKLEALMVLNPVWKGQTETSVHPPNASPGKVPQNFSINRLAIVNSTIDHQTIHSKGSSVLQTKGLNVEINDFQFNNGSIATGEIHTNFRHFQFSTPGGTGINIMQPGNLQLENLFFVRDKEDKLQNRWEFKLSDSKLRGLQLELTNKNKSQQFDIPELEVKNLLLSSDKVRKPAELIQSNPALELTARAPVLMINDTRVDLGTMHLDMARNMARMENINIRPRLERDSFMAASTFQKDHIAIQADQITLSTNYIQEVFRDSLVAIQSVHIYQPQLQIYRDKNLPEEHGKIKPLLTKAIRSIPMRMAIDSIRLHNGRLTYEEKSNKTGKTGSVYITQLNATVGKVISFGHAVNDSISIIADGKLMDSSRINVTLKESYLDSLAGFLITTRLSPTSITILNNMILPTTSIEIKSGWIDSLYMRAVGREYLSLGEMTFYYHQLKIKLHKGGDISQRTLLTDLATFAANSLVVRTNNHRRKGIIYYQRNREKSIVNYIVKMAISGAASSAGVKSSKHYLKQYRKALSEYHLPPIE